MLTGARVYISLIIATGFTVVLLALSQELPGDTWQFGAYLALAIAASIVKVRLPGIDGAYSLGFFFILTGLCCYTISETLVVASASIVAASLISRDTRPTLIQTLFNTANAAISVGVCHLLVTALQAHGLQPYHPAGLASVASLYFVINTVIVSGVLSMLEGKPLCSVWRAWYLWSFSYYMVGVIIVGLLPVAGRSAPPVGWLALLPPLYLLHFFYGLTRERRHGTSSEADSAAPQLPTRARVYVAAVTIAGGLLLSWSLLSWDVAVRFQPIVFLAVAIPASLLKIPLPGVTGTVSLSFVVQLAALAELALPELLLLAGVSAAVQSIWGSDYRPTPIQVIFNVAVMLLSMAPAYLAFHYCRSSLDFILLLSLVVATAVLYFANTFLVAAVLCLVEEKPLSRMWEGCYYWSFPYYVVGAGFASVMASTSTTTSWIFSFLPLPLLALVYLSYNQHLNPLVLNGNDE
jgi:hypothetical protein